MSHKYLLIAASFVLSFSSAVMSAHADVYVKEVSTSSGLSSGSLLLPVNASAQNYFAGLQNIKVSATAPGTDADAQSFLAYCIDPGHYSSTSYIDNFTPSSTSSVASVFATQSSNIQKLFDKYYGATVGSNANAAAFQLALWEIANDDQNLSNGAVQVQTSGAKQTLGSLVTDAQSLLSGYSSYAGPQIYTLTLYQVVNPGPVGATTGQNYIVALVPEPTSFGMLLAGLGLMGFIGRRSMQRTQ